MKTGKKAGYTVAGHKGRAGVKAPKRRGAAMSAVLPACRKFLADDARMARVPDMERPAHLPLSGDGGARMNGRPMGVGIAEV